MPPQVCKTAQTRGWSECSYTCNDIFKIAFHNNHETLTCIHALLAGEYLQWTHQWSPRIMSGLSWTLTFRNFPNRCLCGEVVGYFPKPFPRSAPLATPLVLPSVATGATACALEVSARDTVCTAWVVDKIGLNNRTLVSVPALWSTLLEEKAQRLRVLQS
jgi:hypothetical protein